MCHQGLGFDRMFDCFTYDGACLKDTLSRFRVEPVREEKDGYTVTRIIYSEITDMFSLDMITVNTSATFEGDSRFYGIYVLSGNGTLDGDLINTCDHYFIPASCKSITVKADGDKPITLIRCFGPNA